MSETTTTISSDPDNMEEVNKAIAMLAIRISKLETDAPAIGKLRAKNVWQDMARTGIANTSSILTYALLGRTGFTAILLSLCLLRITIGVANGDGTNLTPVLVALLGSLKELRTSFVTACSEADGKFKELEKFKAENAKLKYQISHLKRSLETEES